MKKLFISSPMKGLSEEDIKELRESMRKIAEIVFDEEFEVIDSYIKEDPPENTNAGLYYLGESLKKMAEADYYIGIDIGYDTDFHGCWIENQAAKKYGMNRYLFNFDKFYVNTDKD